MRVMRMDVVCSSTRQTVYRRDEVALANPPFFTIWLSDESHAVAGVESWDVTRLSRYRAREVRSRARHSSV
jgi:hypothetical protein